MITESFFDKFKRILSGGAVAKKEFIEIVREKTALELTENDFAVRGSVAWIGGGSALKNELFMHKKTILAALTERKSAIRDIRY